MSEYLTDEQIRKNARYNATTCCSKCEWTEFTCDNMRCEGRMCNDCNNKCKACEGDFCILHINPQFGKCYRCSNIESEAIKKKLYEKRFNF